MKKCAKRLKDLALTKRAIRNTILARLNIQKEEDRTEKSSLIKKRLFRQSVFKKAKTVMFYIALSGEVDTKDMIKEAQNLGKKILVPVCWNRTIIACVLDITAKLQRGLYGVWEPVIKKPVDLNELDLVIVPGLAFDKSGNRLGRGKGYYDRFLQKIPHRVTTIGLAFDFQILSSVPSTATDISVKKLLFA
jgi:5-formyltetrahydrofolate cyclo-ligase